MSELDDQLVSELWARDVRFILGTVPNHPPMLPPAELIKGLAASIETRLQLSLIPLFLCHPEFSVHVKDVAKNLPLERQLILKCFYCAALWLERKYLLQNNLPDEFSKELGLSPTSDPDENLLALANRQRELSGARINWIATYQHAADIWLKDIELRKKSNGKRNA
jgi:hypothetical protein